MVSSTRIDDVDEVESSIRNLEGAPSTPEDDSMGPIRLASSFTHHTSPQSSVVGSPTSGAASMRTSTRQVHSESSLSPVISRLRLLSLSGSSSAASPVQQQQHVRIMPSFPPIPPLSDTYPGSPRTSHRRPSAPYFPERHEVNPRRPSKAGSDRRNDIYDDSSSQSQVDSLATTGSQHPPSSERLVPTSERSSQWNTGMGEDGDSDTFNDLADPSREGCAPPVTDAVTPVVFLGFTLPLWCSKKPSWTQVSACVARYAPCFICWIKNFHGTDRAILGRLNVLNAFFAFFQVVVGVWFLILELASFIVPYRIPQYPSGTEQFGLSPNPWNPSGSVLILGVMGFCILLTNLVAHRAIREVNLLGAIRYLWVMLWMLPVEIYFTVSLIDYHESTSVWVTHWWNQPGLAWFRFKWCAPGTANTLCTVPIQGGPNFSSEEAWCENYYNATNCTEIRDSAQSSTSSSLLFFFYCCAGWGGLLIIMILLTVNTLERIISKPIVQKSRESNVPVWLTIPTIGCGVVGAVLRYATTSVLKKGESNNSWIATLYIVTSVLFLSATLTGWAVSAFSILSTRDKRTKLFLVFLFIVETILATVSLTIIFVASIIISANLINVPISQIERSNIACSIDRGITCTGCEAINPAMRCEEWSENDIAKVLQTQLKQSATLAAIFILSAFGAVRFGFVLRRHITMYQIDYV